MARQINGCGDLVWESVIGTKGRAQGGKIDGAKPFQIEGAQSNPYEQEHADLIRSIREGKPLNEGRQVAESTLTAIMGRISAYTGQTVKWEWVLNKSQLDLTPPKYDLAGEFPVAPVSVPGKDELV